ncbi:MAG: hypothetical protein ACOCRX_00520 [Candidatus Woesearchaeota archaeon]
MSFIKKICKGKQDEITKLRFARFGKGTFEKEETKIRKMTTGLKLYTGFLFLNDAIRLFNEFSTGKITVSGSIVSKNLDLELLNKYPLEISKARGRIPRKNVEGELSQQELSDLVDEFEDSFLLLHLKDEKKFYIKTSNKKPPKISKLKEKYVKSKLPKKALDRVKEEFFFDVDKEIKKQATVRELYHIEDIIIPENVEDFAKARIEAKRVGEITRKFEIDGEEIVKKYEINY